MALNKVICKDGSFATQLSKHVDEKIDGHPLWSARFNATNPNAVIKTHLDFLKAGADIILTNTYQASVEGYTKHLNLTKEQSIDLIKSTVKLTHTARDIFLKEKNDKESTAEPLILASIGPYGAHLNDGSEYTGNYIDYVTAEEIINWHRPRIEAVLEAGVDGLAIETIPSQMEAEAIVDFLCSEHSDVKFWVSFQCKQDGCCCLAHGENFKDVCLALWDKLEKKLATTNCLALGVNCLHPELVKPLFESLNSNLGDQYKFSLVAYPNSGETYNENNGWTGKEQCIPLEEYVPTWIKLGAKIIGGCCRVTANDIHDIKECITKLSS